MKIRNCLCIATALSVLFCSCGATLPSVYSAKNSVKYKGHADVGQFTYLPAERGKLKPNQIKNKTLGIFYFENNVADMARRATGQSHS